MKHAPVFLRSPRIISVIVSLYCALFFLVPINLITSDLGRHIQNGKAIVLTVGERVAGEGVFDWALHDGVGSAQSPEAWKSAAQYSIFSENYYSYTAPETIVYNHHWFFGVLSYALFLVGGFPLLSISNAVIIFAAVYTMLSAARLRGSLHSALLAAVVLLPLVVDRTEVRPESISLLFSAVFFLLLQLYQQGKKSLTTVGTLLVIIQLLWVNTHLFFVLGIGILGFFWLEALFHSREKLLPLSVLGGVLIVLSFCNPNGIAGALAPFTIFKNYEFAIAENQSTFFMLRVLPEAVHWYYLIVLAIATILFLWVFIKSQRTQKLHILLFAIFVATLAVIGLNVNRFYTFFGLLSLPILSVILNDRWVRLKTITEKLYHNSFALPALSLAVFAIAGAMLTSSLFLPPVFSFGIGLAPDVLAGATFFRETNLVGPIFNNYDIGGYLILNVFPATRVYTDNRPEAYPTGFFPEYTSILASDEKWNDAAEKSDIKVIFFHRNDLTDYGQAFLYRRIQDPLWAPVFVDNYALILVKRIPEHAEIIKQFELPKEMFSANTNELFK